MRSAALKTESPIEALLLRAIEDEIWRCGLKCSLATQVKVGPYRVDIMLQVGARKLVVECDGAAYHAAAKEQVDRDKRRDRFFAAQGISVMRFTGSEINRSARACASEVGAWVEVETAAGPLKHVADPAVRKTLIMARWERGEISRLQACRSIRRLGLIAA